MTAMIVNKVLNNSLILSTDKEDNEVIIMGKGIGFNSKVGDIVPEDKIEKCFVLQQTAKYDYYIRILESTPIEYVELVQFILHYAAKQLNSKLRDALFFTLLDHLSYAIERHYKGIIIQNRLLYEVKSFYPKEFTIAKYVIEHINHTLNITLPEEEAGNIAFHLVNGQSDNQEMADTLLSAKLLKDIFNLIQYHFSITINKKSLNYSRFLTHMQYFIQRLLDNSQMNSQDNFIFSQIIIEYPNEYKCARIIQQYINKQLNISISNDEMMYLILHIIRIVR